VPSGRKARQVGSDLTGEHHFRTRNRTDPISGFANNGDAPVSRARVRELLSDWPRLSLSTATINPCVHEVARAVEPVVENKIQEAVRNVERLYADETSWKEHDKQLWLWVFT